MTPGRRELRDAAPWGRLWRAAKRHPQHETAFSAQHQRKQSPAMRKQRRTRSQVAPEAPVAKEQVRHQRRAEEPTDDREQ